MKKFIIYLVTVAILAASCIGFNTLKVKKTNFDEEVQRAQNLVFTFNKELMSDTSRLNKWDSAAYMKFEPAINGKFMWTGKNELTFSPSGLMPPSTDFKAILLPAIGKFAHHTYELDDSPITFHTPYLSLLSTNSYWALSDDIESKVQAHVLLTFNNPVSPQRLKSFLHFRVLNKEINFQILSQSESDIIEVSLEISNSLSENSSAGEIEIDKGMPSVGGNVSSTEAIKAEFTVPDKDKLLITSMETSFDKGKGVITVFTSLPLAAQSIESLVTTDPKIKVEAEIVSNGFTLTGDFQQNEGYTVKISPQLKSVFGTELGEEYSETVTFGVLEPYIGFKEDNATYLSYKGNRNLAVQIINVPKVRVTVFKVFENNLLHYLKQGKSWDYVYQDDEYYDYYGYTFNENFGRPVMSKEIFTRSLPRSGNLQLLNLDLDELKFSESYKGVYLVKVESPDKRWLQAVQMVAFSDLGMIIKQGSADVTVFVNSLLNVEPVKGATLEFISTNNQKIYTAVTDNRGVAVFKNYSKIADGFTLGMVVCKYQNDFNFVMLDNSRVETSRFDIGGKRMDNLAYDVFIYGDRNLYRPGDTVHINTLVRTLRWETVRDIPLKIKLIGPNGKEFVSLKKQLNSSGAAEASCYIPRQAMTGTYLIEAYSGNNVLLASRRISVEEFVPDRIKSNVKTDKAAYHPGEPVVVDVLAENLFGTPATGKKVETELRLNRKIIKSAAFADYNFNVVSKDNSYLSSITKEAVTDGSGQARISLETPTFSNIGLLEGSLFTTVFDETGRPVNRLNRIAIPTQNVFLGIKSFDEWLSTRKPLNFAFAAVDQYGKAVNTAVARVIISYYRYETVIERGYSRYSYVSQKKESILLSKNLSIKGGKADLTFTPPRSGEYEIKLMLPESDNYVSATFYAYGWGDTDYSSFEVNREGEIIITADKETYKPGEKAKLLFKAPFDGKLLVTFEQDNVLDYKYIELKNKSASIDFPVTTDHLPNIYVDATAFRKTSDEYVPLTVAHGITSLKVNDPARKLSLALKTPEKSRSGVKQTITLNTIPNAEVTISVVDEGILQITDYKSPDPYDWFYGKRTLGVNSFDLYGQLYPELKPSSKVAGGEAFDLSRRLNPLTGERVKLISKWSGLIKSNSAGNCSFSIDIPQFSGALRVMAVAYKDNKFGSAEKTIKVADPVVISTALPRFLSPSDKVDMNVNLTNTTSSSAQASVVVKVSGPVKINGSPNGKIQLPAGKEKKMEFVIQALENVGNATVQISVDAMGQKFQQELTIPVRPASGLTVVHGSGSINGGAQKSVKINADLIPAGSRSKLYLSKSPVARYVGSLNYLLRYPYGCLEQTVSTAFPQIYFKDLVKLMSKGAGQNERYDNPDFNVQQAIVKAESFQLYNGGFSLWEAGDKPYWWASVYALHFLYEASQAGFDINRKTFDAGLTYLEQKVKERETSVWYYYEDNVRKSRTVPSPEIFYSLYVLALTDRPDLSAMNYYRSQLASMTPESRYLLAASYMLAGDRKTYQALLPRAFGNEHAETQSGGNLGSYTRDLAISLNALLEADPNNPQVGEMMKSLTEEVSRQNRYYSTQEDAFVMLVIGKQARRAAKTDITAQLSINGKPVSTFSNNDLLLNNDLLNKTLGITARGNGILYYSYELSGLTSKVKSGTEDQSIKVRRRFLDRNGREIGGNSFSPNDLVVVEVTAEAVSGKQIDNVAITDLLPACFEIENSRLVAEREMSWIKERSIPEYTDIRDDRISFFTSLGSKKSTFYYSVRVVSRGVFTLGPVGADAMYNGAYHSYSGSGIVKVQ